MAGLIRVAIVDDHPATASGLAEILSAEPDIEVVGTAGDLAGARQLLTEAQVDVVLCDIALPDGHGFDLLREPQPETQAAVVFFSSYDYAGFHARIHELGGAGYLLKTAPVAEVIGAIRTVAAGGTAFDLRHVRSARSASRQPSERELAIIRLVAAGRSNEEIAAALSISFRTVESHLRRLFARHGISSRTGLAMLAVREGWAWPSDAEHR